jgi:hypothetical protein
MNNTSDNDKLAEAVKVTTRIPGVVISNLGRDIGYPDRFSWYSTASPDICRVRT